jgi:hypothetical protein
MEVSSEINSPAALPQEKNPLCPLNRRLDGPQSYSADFGEEKNILYLPGIKPWIIQPIT